MEYVYAALLLHKLGKSVDEENLKKVIESTGTQVDEAKVKLLVANLKDVNIDEELEKAVSVAPVASAAGLAEEEKKEEKKEEEKPSAAAEGLSSLFG
jgi:large subunit ribosomal protein L12